MNFRFGMDVHLTFLHIWRPWKLSNFHGPPLLCPSTSKIFSPPGTWKSNFKRTPSPTPPLTHNTHPHTLSNKLWNNNHTVHVNKQNQVTWRSSWPPVLLFDLAHKQCHGIIKEWLHCLTSLQYLIFALQTLEMNVICISPLTSLQILLVTSLPTFLLDLISSCYGTKLVNLMISTLTRNLLVKFIVIPHLVFELKAKCVYKFI